jgi:hypothetical protein
VADPKAPDVADEEEADPGPYFCFCCDNADVTRCDEDRCCVECGMDLVPLSQMRELLRSAHGLHIVSEADKRVLDAMAALHIDNVRSYDHESNKRHWEYPAMMSELARRKP